MLGCSQSAPTAARAAQSAADAAASVVERQLNLILLEVRRDVERNENERREETRKRQDVEEKLRQLRGELDDMRSSSVRRDQTLSPIRRFRIEGNETNSASVKPQPYLFAAPQEGNHRVVRMHSGPITRRATLQPAHAQPTELAFSGGSSYMAVSKPAEPLADMMRRTTMIMKGTMVGLDFNNDGKPDVFVAAPDLSADPIAEIMPRPSPRGTSPVTVVPPAAAASPVTPRGAIFPGPQLVAVPPSQVPCASARPASMSPTPQGRKHLVPVPVAAAGAASPRQPIAEPTASTSPASVMEASPTPMCAPSMSGGSRPSGARSGCNTPQAWRPT